MEANALETALKKAAVVQRAESDGNVRTNRCGGEGVGPGGKSRSAWWIDTVWSGKRERSTRRRERHRIGGDTRGVLRRGGNANVHIGNVSASVRNMREINIRTRTVAKHVASRAADGRRDRKFVTDVVFV